MINHFSFNKGNRKIKKFSKRNNHKNQFIQLIDFIKESKKYIYSITILFFFSFLIGLLVKLPSSIQEQLIDIINKVVEETSNLSFIQTISFIVFNNLKSVFIGIFFGIFFGIIPIISTILNGILLGFVSSLSVSKQGILSLWKIFPHGIFEIPAILISLGLGLRIGLSFFKRKKEDLKIIITNSLKMYVYIILPLLIIAGIIEGLLIYLLK